jgi:hypothetical protein
MSGLVLGLEASPASTLGGFALFVALGAIIREVGSDFIKIESHRRRQGGGRVAISWVVCRLFNGAKAGRSWETSRGILMVAVTKPHLELQGPQHGAL